MSVVNLRELDYDGSIFRLPISPFTCGKIIFHERKNTVDITGVELSILVRRWCIGRFGAQYHEVDNPDGVWILIAGRIYFTTQNNLLLFYLIWQGANPLEIK